MRDRGSGNTPLERPPTRIRSTRTGSNAGLSSSAYGTISPYRNADPITVNQSSDRELKMHYLLVAITLYLFWLLLSGHFTLFFLVLGGLSVALVVWLLRRMDRTDGRPITLHPSLGLFGYAGWLLKCVVQSNIDVATRIWDPALPIRPSWGRLDTKVSSSLEKTLYANSITLTPGTLTTDVRDDHFLVHSLTQEGIAELREGEMERRIRRLGI